MNSARLFIDGAWVDGESTTIVADKFTGAPATTLHVASREQVALATRRLGVAQERIRLTPYERYLALSGASTLLRERRDAFTDAVITDTGFTVADAEREVDRAVETLLLCAEEAKRITGEVVPLSSAPTAPERLAFTIRRPLGVVCAITPFNSPLNTVVHKVGPAIAAGNAIVLKPAATTPYTAVLLVELLLDAGVPPELIALVNGPGSTVGQWLLEDEVPAFYAFTGSTEVGSHVHRTVGVRRTQLEMGSLSSTIVCADADLDTAVARSVNAAFRKAGQVCTSVQRLYVEQSIEDEFRDRLVRALAGADVGDPRQRATFVGPVISPAEGDRIRSWVARALDRGARALVGGADGTAGLVSPTVLSDVAADMDVMCREVFGPVVTLRTFTDLDAALTEIDATPYGLSAGVFTSSIDTGLKVAKTLRMGSIHINETSSSRVDLQPYGGVKLSGHGLEGPRYAVQQMTEECLVTLGPTT